MTGYTPTKQPPHVSPSSSSSSLRSIWPRTPGAGGKHRQQEGDGVATTNVTLAERQPDGIGASQSSSSSSSSTAATVPRAVRGTYAGTAGDAFTSPVERHSPSSPWTNPPSSARNAMGTTATTTAMTADRSPTTQTSPELSAFYGGSSTSNGPFGRVSGPSLEQIGPSSSNLFAHRRQYGTDHVQSKQFDEAGSVESVHAMQSGANGEEALFFERDPLLLPRRNHTIASSAAVYRKRLDQHFHQGSATSPSKNSLSAITGGKEDADDDWEAMIKGKGQLLLPDEDEREILESSSSFRSIGLDSGGHPFASSHRRFPSQPISTFGTSPIDSNSPASSRGGHQRSESADLYGRLDQGPFASSPIVHGSAFGGTTSAGIVRRHQSLNHHTGRQFSSRLHQSHASLQPPAQHSNPTFGGGGGGGRRYDSSSSPAKPLHSNGSPRLSPIGDKSGFPSFSSERGTALSTQHEEERPFPSSQLSTSLVDAHAQFAQMSLRKEDERNESSPTMHEGQTVSKPKLSSLITNRDTLARAASSQAAGGLGGPVSASAYVPPIGHAHHRRHSSTSSSPQVFIPKGEGYRGKGGMSVQGRHAVDGRSSNVPLRGPQTAFPGGLSSWHSTDHGSGFQAEGATPTHSALDLPYVPNANEDMRMGSNAARQSLQRAHAPSAGLDPYTTNVLPGPMTYGDNGDASRAMWAAYHQNPSAYPQVSHMMPPAGGLGFNNVAFHPQQASLVRASQPQQQSDLTTDPNVRALIASKGYNPPLTQVNINAPKARFFVIKSFTEDDVQRSLKHEIWASTEKGNQRLDRAFKESSQEGPLFLLFSVNASGHFCGVAEMLTPLDYSSDSTVWVQEGKWKGTFNVRWIYVKDVPNSKLRHIRLTNTTDCKPITQSRDTQELPTDGGRQALRIMAEFPSRTTLLQDWLFYETQGEAQSNSGQGRVPPTSVQAGRDGQGKRTPTLSSLPTKHIHQANLPHSMRQQGAVQR